MAHNEAATMEAALLALLAQRVVSADVQRVVVVSSGSTDGTDDIVAAIARRAPRVHLRTQPGREGKISADNVFLSEYPARFHVLCNADVVLAPGALEALVAPLRLEGVAMTGARVVPRVRPLDEARFFDFANRLLWAVHHRLVVRTPKMGEAVAFARLVERIPEDAIADEAWLEAFATTAGYEVRYVPEAVAFAGCPLTLRDYFAVRRRNFCAHLRVERLSSHRVATLSSAAVARATFETLSLGAAQRLAGASAAERLRELPRLLRFGLWTGAVVALEIAARVAGAFDAWHRSDVHRRWHMAASARRADAERATHAASPSESTP